MPTVCTSLNISRGLGGGRAGKGYACVVRSHVQVVETRPVPGSHIWYGPMSKGLRPDGYLYGEVPCLCLSQGSLNGEF